MSDQIDTGNAADAANDASIPGSPGGGDGAAAGTLPNAAQQADADHRLRAAIEAQLSQRLDLDLDAVEILVDHGVVRLKGTVPLRRMLHPIAALVAKCAGVASVENRLVAQVQDITAEQPERAPAADDSFDEDGEAGESQINHKI